MKEKCIRVYDSMGGNHDRTLHLLLDYLELEHQDKKGEPMDMSDWEIEAPKDIPQQENMSDCGVFACTFADRLSRGSLLDLSQQDMRLLRRRMVLNILNKRL
jgi:sentrin-specific protease 1